MPITPAEVMKLVSDWRAEAAAIRSARGTLVAAAVPVTILDFVDESIIEKFATQLEGKADELEALLNNE